jgi:hypothetical protein
MLNHIIRLQAVIKIITNKTTKDLNLLAKQSTEMRNAIYHNHLALDYLLASEGGVCGIFNLSNCCLQIHDEGKVIEGINMLGTNAFKPAVLHTCYPKLRRQRQFKASLSYIVSFRITWAM